MGKQNITKKFFGESCLIHKIERSNIMDKLDFEEVSKHTNIMNVAYHLSLEITEKRGLEIKAICPFCRL